MEGESLYSVTMKLGWDEWYHLNNKLNLDLRKKAKKFGV